MAVAIIHYHLRRGGVTRVIEAQSAALRQAGIDHVIIAGTPYKGRADLPVAVVPALDYRVSKSDFESQSLIATIRQVAATALGRPAGAWHIHNPVLGKNPFFPDLVGALGASREPLVLHFHDFAEDGRPQNYEMIADCEHLYPIAPHISYAFINSRDRNLLINAGIPSENTAFLPNAIVQPAPAKRSEDGPATATCHGDLSRHSAAKTEAQRRLVLYPVRGIRRKNLGEICLLAGLAPTGTRFAITLAPENPVWHEIHAQWVRFAADEGLNVQFGVVGNHEPAPGVQPTFENWLSHATHLVTTSIAEGFGMSFLEPIALGKPLIGRDLPEITRDFKHDLALGQLYDQLLIPQAWIDQTQLFRSLEIALQDTYTLYREELSVNTAVRAGDALFHDGYCDFGALPEALQREAASRAFRDPDCVLLSLDGERIPAAAWLAEALQITTPAAPRSALDRYSVSRYAELLTGLYQTLHDREPAPPRWLKNAKVLHQFLQPERFHFLRT